MTTVQKPHIHYTHVQQMEHNAQVISFHSYVGSERSNQHILQINPSHVALLFFHHCWSWNFYIPPFCNRPTFYCFHLCRRKLDTQAYCHIILGPLHLFVPRSYSHLLFTPTSLILHLFSGYNQEVFKFLVPNAKIPVSLRAHMRLKDVNQLSMNIL